ncbi:branched-chain amino acid ABC transporter permease [Tardiphaga sp. OK245]|uniref:branched-chain amino acid ABC transporter permease n=1 Tax=Tardiphaga sp. OK245 TaxID=1855306 RepID=UPI0008A7AF66|nr:branched-chain amino acid ABC transporter permease [Tardiphaga sp. OK245]SEI21048.1 branched-chain amino acid transport system permease protein [Tardiphaga sp. OK245]
MELAASILIDSSAYGMTLFMIAVGLSVTLGLMRVVNLAHGLFAVLGGYLTWWTMQNLHVHYAIAVVAAVLGVAVVGLVLERTIYRFIYARGPLDQVLLSIGVVFVGIAVTGVLFGDGLKSVQLPPLLSGSTDIGFRVIPTHRILVVFSGICVVFLIWMVFQYTRFGVRLRAAVDNTSAAEALGIDSRALYAIAFSLGAALAAFGGILGAEIMQIEPFYPMKYLVLFLAVVAVGGLGNIWGSLGAAMLLGTVDTSCKYLLPAYGSMLTYAAMLAVLSIRPLGLFGSEEA